MKICVLNGSPRGNYSVTLHTVLFLQKKFPQCQFEVLNVGQKIKAYQKDFSQPMAMVQDADLLLFSYPVYTFIAPYQLHKFIELLKTHNVNLQNKWCAQITTSKHFYDVTAHNYVKENCLDLGMKYLGGLSADMEDILSKQGQVDAVNFWNYTMFCVENGIFEQRGRTVQQIATYVAQADNAGEKLEDFDTVIVANMQQDDQNLANMIADFQAVYPYKTRIVNIAEYPFMGGCLGCFNCAVDGKCIYRDGFDTFLREQIQSAKSIVYAFTIADHSMGAIFKMYDDRQFCNGHRTVTMGMPIAYIVNGNLDAEPNLKTIIEGRADVGHNFLAGVATDFNSIKQTAQKLSYALKTGYVLPQTFYGVGGLKIFRDLIFLMQGMMKADHKFYKKHGFYDFPQKRKGTILKMKLVGMLLSNPKIKAKMGNKMNEGMVAPYKKVLANLDKSQKGKK